MNSPTGATFVRATILLLTAVGCILMLAGCGAGSPNTTSSAHISTQRAAVSVAMAPGPPHLGAAETHQFSASVTNAADPAVTWSVSACTSSCGSIDVNGLYTAPSFVPTATTATITATSREDPTKSARSTLLLKPVSVTLSPSTPANVQPGATRAFTATLDHDPSHAGAVWTVSGAGCSGAECGTLSDVNATSATYHAPASAPAFLTIKIVATSTTDPNQSAWVNLVVSSAPVQLAGRYAFLIHGYRYGELVAIAGHLEADGAGHFTGVWDANRGAAAELAQPILGTYDVQPDGTGTLTIEEEFVPLDSGTYTYTMVVNEAGTTARFAQATPAGNYDIGSSGYMVRQDAEAFNLSSIAGDRVLATYGEATYSHVAALGRFTGSAEGALNSGTMDLSWSILGNYASFPNPVVLTGSFGAPDPLTGRGTASLVVTAGATAMYNFAYYIVSPKRLLLVQTDARGCRPDCYQPTGPLIPTLMGEIRRQENAGSFSTLSLNAPMVFHLSDAAGDGGLIDLEAKVRIGRMLSNGAAELSFTFDQNTGGRVLAGATASSTYSVEPNGRVTWSIPVKWGTPHEITIQEPTIAYLVDDNTGYVMTRDWDGAGFGAFQPQTQPEFRTNALAGTFQLSTAHPSVLWAENDTGWMIVGDDGTVTATLYINEGSGASPFHYTGSAMIGSNGQGMLILETNPPAAAQHIAFWAISPDYAVAIMTVTPGDGTPVLLELHRVD